MFIVVTKSYKYILSVICLLLTLILLMPSLEVSHDTLINCHGSVFYPSTLVDNYLEAVSEIEKITLRGCISFNKVILSKNIKYEKKNNSNGLIEQKQLKSQLKLRVL